MTIKDAFLEETDTSGFGGMIGESIRSGALEVVRRERFQHRHGHRQQPAALRGDRRAQARTARGVRPAA